MASEKAMMEEKTGRLFCKSSVGDTDQTLRLRRSYVKEDLAKIKASVDMQFGGFTLTKGASNAIYT